jgi:hypothetical protein
LIALLIINASAEAKLAELVIQPDTGNTGVWHVMTGWDSTSREADAYRRHGG